MKRLLLFALAMTVVMAAGAQVAPTVPKPKPTKPKPSPTLPTLKEPKADIVYHSAECVEQNGKMNLVVDVSYRVENHKGKEVQARCIVDAPHMFESPSGRKINRLENPISEQRQQFVSNRMSHEPGLIKVNDVTGMRAEVHSVKQSREDVNDRFVIPICEIDFKHYEKQKVSIKVEVFDIETNRIIGIEKFEQELKPVTLYVDKSRRSQTVNFEWNGGNHVFDISSCSGYRWKDVPSWIQTSGSTITAESNSSRNVRSATLRVVPNCDSDEEVKIYVTQACSTASQTPPPSTYTPTDVPKLEDDVIIESVTWEYNVDNTDYMMFHINIPRVANHRGEELRVYALFFNADGETKVLNRDGEWISDEAFAMTVIKYDNAKSEDFKVLVKQSDFMRAPNLQGKEVVVYLAATFDNGASWEATSGPYKIRW